MIEVETKVNVSTMLVTTDECVEGAPETPLEFKPVIVCAGARTMQARGADTLDTVELVHNSRLCREPQARFDVSRVHRDGVLYCRRCEK